VSQADDMQNERINGLDDRLRSVEAAVVELATMAKWMKYAVIVMGMGLGFDMQGMM